MSKREKFMIAMTVFSLCLGLLALTFVWTQRAPHQPGPASSAPVVASSPASSSGLTYPGAYPGAASPPPPAAPPVFNWVEIRKETFVLAAGSGTAWGPVPGMGEGFIRYDIQSAQPVNTGIMEEAVYESDRNAAVVSLAHPVESAWCFSPKVIQSQMSCKFPVGQNATIVILDTRDPNAAGLAAIGAALGVKEPLNRAVAENRVTLTLYGWGCVQNCKQVLQ